MYEGNQRDSDRPSTFRHNLLSHRVSSRHTTTLLQSFTVEKAPSFQPFFFLSFFLQPLVDVEFNQFSASDGAVAATLAVVNCNCCIKEYTIRINTSNDKKVLKEEEEEEEKLGGKG